MLGRLLVNASASSTNRKTTYTAIVPAESTSKIIRQATDILRWIFVAVVIAVAAGWISEDIIAPAKKGIAVRKIMFPNNQSDIAIPPIIMVR